MVLKSANISEIVLGKSQIALMRTDEYSGVLMRSPMYSVLIDPLSFDLMRSPIPNVILISHEHPHHLNEDLIFLIFNVLKEQVERREKKGQRFVEEMELPIVLANQASVAFLRRFVPKENLKALKPGEEFVFEMMTIKAFRSVHPSAKLPLTYLVIFENGIRIFHASDSLPCEEMRRIGEEEKPDIVFVATGFDAGLSIRTAVDIANMTNAKLVIPLHGKSDKFSSYAKKKTVPFEVIAIGPNEIHVYG